MYEAFFKLRSKPFDLLPDPRFIFLSKSHKKALTYLDYGIRERSGFVLLTGEVGSGKTTLIRNLLDKHYDNVILSKIFNTKVTSEQLLSMINDDFGLDVHGKDKITLIRELNEFLIHQFASGNQPILIIDEAQNLSAELLEEVRMLSNLEASTSKLMQIILVGQPELRTILASPELRQLRQRININCHLQALSREEVELYISRRLEVAGNPSAVTFEREALEAIFRHSRGIPRLINIICDFLMFLAFAEETTILNVDMVHDVISDLDFENYYWSGKSIAPAESVQINKPTPSEHFPAGTAHIVPAEPDVASTLATIAARIEAIEQNITTSLNKGLKEQNDRFSTLQSVVQSHVEKTNADIVDMRKKFEEYGNTAIRLQGGTVLENSKTGFVRRVFGVDPPLANSEKQR